MIIREIWHYRQMIFSLVKRDLRGRYKGSFLGFLWTFLNPLLQLVVYTIVFSVIMRAGIEDYYLFCMDDDGQTPASFIPELLQAIRDRADVAYARYEHKQHSWFRNLGSKINDLMAQKLIGKPKALFLSSFFAMKRYIMIELFGIKNWWKSYLQNMTLIR